MNQERRKFIKTACLCGGFLLAGKVVGSLFPSLLRGGVAEAKSSNTSGVKKISGGKSSAFYDNQGNKVLIIEK